jgi:carbamoyltransferase
MRILSYFHGIDPAAAVFADGRLIAYVEEERLLRNKHAPNIFPIRSIDECLRLAGLSLSDVDHIVYGWNAQAYESGAMAQFYESVNARYPPDPATLLWQQRTLHLFNPASLERTLRSHISRWFGVASNQMPPLEYYPHHKAHAAAAFLLSPFEEALVLTLDGSGDSDCTVVWHGRGTTLEPMHRIEIPHSLGWFYAAVTEYLGFAAYDGEYKVMGLAAYGRENLGIRQRLEKIVGPGASEFDYVVEPRFIHHGKHTYSDRFTDDLVDLLGLPPRHGKREIEPIHEDIAFEAQRLLEETTVRLVAHFGRKLGVRRWCIGGGVGLNVKLNSRLLRQDLVDEISPFPIPNDSGLAIGAAVGLWTDRTGERPEPIEHLYLGPGFTDQEIERQLQECGTEYKRPADIAHATAELLADGKVVAWFQGRMEGGPRALGGRSILADPRETRSRDRVNAAIKFREYWRPFCPSLTVESASRYLKNPVLAPFMIIALEANEEARRNVPAVVHVDGTVRCQTVDQNTNPRYYTLLKAFERITGHPVLLNTSFNINGEAIVCTPRDALRTFFATGIDALAIGAFLIEKPRQPLSSRRDYEVC